jgi:hypothetical protein
LGCGEFHAVNQDADVVPIYRVRNHAGRQRKGKLAGQIDKPGMGLGGNLDSAADLDHGRVPCVGDLLERRQFGLPRLGFECGLGDGVALNRARRWAPSS